MKRQVRRGVFESNSSSTHSLQICTKEEFDKWKNGEILLDYWNDEFVYISTLSYLTDEEKDDVKKSYEKRKQKYWKNWDELSEEEKEELYQKAINDKKDYEGLKTYREYFYSYDLETFERSYTSPSGDKLVIFGKYGYDG